MERIITLEKIDSTNKYAITSFDSFPDKALITSKIQTTGKGRRQNAWFSPDYVNLYASYILKTVNFNVPRGSWIGGLATLYTLRELAPQKEFWIKWPNDTFCGNKKISGVLCETVSDIHNKIKGVVIGIGININMPSEELKKIEKSATSLLVETGKEVSVSETAEVLLKHLDTFTAEAIKNDEFLYNKWKKENKIVGKNVTIEIIGKGILTGKVIDIKPEGELYVIDEAGEFHTIYSGDVTIKSFIY
jgi:BirA family biotin operon repressor/biotin-[acetyl-CoA-carboxylase] ligase